MGASTHTFKNAPILTGAKVPQQDCLVGIKKKYILRGGILDSSMISQFSSSLIFMMCKKHSLALIVHIVKLRLSIAQQ